MARTRASRPPTRRRLNAGIAIRRSRVWSGGSTASMCRASAGPGSPSPTTSPLRASAACMSLDSRGSFSAALASSWPTTSHAECPSASVTWCTGPAARICANSGNGSSRSWSPHESSAGWRAWVCTIVVIVTDLLVVALDPCSGPLAAARQDVAGYSFVVCSFAVWGPNSAATSTTMSAGKPPRRACSRTVSASSVSCRQ